MIKDISVVIVNWNSNNLVEKQLQSLEKHIQQIILVDNNSDDSLKTIVNKYKNVTLIENSFNKGFAAACNQGLNLVKNKWTLFLNPDVEITNDNITQLLEYAKSKNLDAVSVNSNANEYSKPIPTVYSLVSEFSFLNRIIPLNIFKSKTLIGGIVCINTNILKCLCGWDERFFLWFEDSDLTKRLVENNHKIGFANIKIKHIGGFSLKRLTQNTQKDLFFNAMDVYSRKHFSKFQQKVISLIKKRFTNKQKINTINDNIISVVVPNVSLELLNKFLENNKMFFPSNLELIIVSNGLNKLNIWDYRKEYSNVKFIAIQNNHGFAHTVNIGLRASTGKYVGTCNDDVILQKDWIDKLLNSTNSKTGSVNPLIYDLNGNIESAGIKVLAKGKALPITKVPIKTSVVDATNGACVLYNNTVLTKVGLFDERFGSYLEDIDLSLRISRSGFENIICRDVNITHLKHQTSNLINFNKSYHDFKNWILVILKNWSLKMLLSNLISIKIERLRNLSGLIKSKFVNNNK